MVALKTTRIPSAKVDLAIERLIAASFKQCAVVLVFPSKTILKYILLFMDYYMFTPLGGEFRYTWENYIRMLLPYEDVHISNVKSIVSSSYNQILELFRAVFK